MPTIPTEFSCPKCKRETGKLTQLLASEGKLTCPTRPDHRWVDTEAFYEDGPTIDFKVQLVKAVQTDVGPIKITIKNHLKTNAEAKFGDKLDSTIAQIIETLVEGDVLMIGKTDMERLRDRLGKMPSNSSELVGLIYAKMCEVDEAKGERDQAVQDLKAYESYAPGRVVVDLGQNLNAAAEKAKDAQMPLKLWLQDRVSTALSENWF